MNVLFYTGGKIGKDTIMKEGVLKEENGTFCIESKGETKCLNKIVRVELKVLNGLGHVIKIQNEMDCVFIAVPRLYLKIGNGFAVINTKKTFDLFQKLKLNEGGL